MKHYTTRPGPVRKDCHITDLFFRSELIQLAGSDAGDRWFREQSRGAVSNRFYGVAHQTHVPADSNPTCPQPARSEAFHFPAETEISNSNSKLPNQDILNPMYLSMDEYSPYHLGSVGSSMLSPCQDYEDDIGLLFTDAAHTVLTRLSSRSSR